MVIICTLKIISPAVVKGVHMPRRTICKKAFLKGRIVIPHYTFDWKDRDGGTPVNIFLANVRDSENPRYSGNLSVDFYVREPSASIFYFGSCIRDPTCDGPSPCFYDEIESAYIDNSTELHLRGVQSERVLFNWNDGCDPSILRGASGVRGGEVPFLRSQLRAIAGSVPDSSLASLLNDMDAEWRKIPMRMDSYDGPELGRKKYVDLLTKELEGLDSYASGPA
jgi:hypothetical protein